MVEDVAQEQQTNKHSSSGCVRYVFAMMGFLGYCLIFSLRVNLSVAIVAMVNATAVYGDRRTRSKSWSNECISENFTWSLDEEDHPLNRDGEFVWSPQLQGLILGAFYYGYCITQIPGGRLAEIYGGKIVFGVGILGCSILNMLTPIAARMNVLTLILMRVALGLAQGVTMPAMHSMLGRWLPDSEKVFLTSIVYNGIGVGTLAGMTISGILCDSAVVGGWPSAFYIFGLAGCVWFVIWMISVTDSPTANRFISDKELLYITCDQKIDSSKKLKSIPWCRILLSVPFWALVATQFGHNWYFVTLLVDLPTYMSTILHVKIRMNGLLSSMPYFLQMLFSTLSGYLADVTIRRKLCTTEFSRKFCNTFGNISVVLGLLVICFIGCNSELIYLFMILIGMGGVAECGYMLNHLDLSPEYAGTLMGIANAIGELSGFISPAVVGALVDEQQTRERWLIVFIIAAVLALVTALVFILFGTTKKQDWSDEDDKLSRKACPDTFFKRISRSPMNLAFKHEKETRTPKQDDLSPRMVSNSSSKAQ